MMAFWSKLQAHIHMAVVALALLALLLVAGPAYTQVYSPNMDPPTLISPADGAQTTGDPNAPPGYVSYPPLGIPTFVWSAVPGATKYKLEISASPVFQPLILLRDNLKYTHYTPTGEGDISGSGFTDHTLFYWRVSAWDPQANAWTQPSTAWSFTRNWGMRPATLSPTHLATLPFTPRFEWTPVIGTREYELQIATSPNFQTPTTYRTKNPFFTPPNALANDVDYWWRVRARDKMDNSGDWSNDGNGWQLRVRWSYWSVDGERRPRPLTPPNLTVVEGMPLFTWTPVAGAKTYILELNTDPNFHPNFRIFQIETPNTAYAYPLDSNYPLYCYKTYYWRVRARNADGYYGQWNSDTPAINYAFRTADRQPGCPDPPPPPTPPPPNVIPASTGPNLLYPLPYYDPSINVGAFSDRTIPIGTFMWDHIPGATAYTLEVDDDPVFNPPLWTTTTQNLSVSLDVPFNPGTDYYWRVRPDLVSACDPSLSGGDRCSDIWNTRVDPSLLGGHTAPPPQLLRPTYKQEADLRTYGYESVEYWPLFEWLPVTGATGYRIQIAKYSDMTGIIDDHITRLTNYTPLTRYPWGTYYWRVCALNSGGSCSGGWSSVYRFLVSSQIQVAAIANNGNNDFPSSARLGTDPAGDAAAGGFDLRELYTAVGRTTSTGPDMWYIGLQAAAPINGPVRYGIYLDKNRAECINAPPSCDSGADRDPLVGLSLTATPPHWPEYAIYVDAANGCAAPTALLYSWTGTAWGIGIPLPNLQGWVACDATTGFIKLAVPFTAIGNPYSISFMAFSANRDTGQTTDTVPQNAENTNLTTLISFATDSLAPSPVLPPNNPAQSSARIFHPSVPILMWHTLDNMWTYRIQVALDYGFSNIYRNEQGWAPNTMAYDELNPYYTSRLAYADNSTYYWRTAVVYSSSGQSIQGQYGQSSQFSKFAKVPVNLRVMPLAISGTITYTWRTPTFAWDAAEAAAQYRLRVYPGGGSTPVFSVETSQTDYTWTETLDDGAYRWTLEAKDADGGYSTNLAAGWFTKVYSAVVPLYPLTPTATLDPLEFRWQPLSVATRYQVQTASDPNFSSNVNTYTTFNTVFTPEQKPSAIRPGYDWYWRVRLIDGSGRYGPWVQLHIGYNNKVYIPLVVK